MALFPLLVAMASSCSGDKNRVRQSPSQPEIHSVRFFEKAHCSLSRRFMDTQHWEKQHLSLMLSMEALLLW